MTRTEFHKGDRVAIELPADAALLTTKWFPKAGATGTVERTFKNGSVAVAVDQIYNRSTDGVKTLHLDADTLRPIA